MYHTVLSPFQCVGFVFSLKMISSFAVSPLAILHRFQQSAGYVVVPAVNTNCKKWKGPPFLVQGQQRFIKAGEDIRVYGKKNCLEIQILLLSLGVLQKVS